MTCYDPSGKLEEFTDFEPTQIVAKNKYCGMVQYKFAEESCINCARELKIMTKEVGYASVKAMIARHKKLPIGIGEIDLAPVAKASESPKPCGVCVIELSYPGEEADSFVPQQKRLEPAGGHA